MDAPMGELSSAGVFPKSDSLPTAGQHSRFFDVQSDFFALSGKATSDELVRIQELLLYIAWKKNVNDDLTSEEAWSKYAEMIDALKAKYGPNAAKGSEIADPCEIASDDASTSKLVSRKAITFARQHGYTFGDLVLCSIAPDEEMHKHNQTQFPVDAISSNFSPKDSVKFRPAVAAPYYSTPNCGNLALYPKLSIYDRQWKIQPPGSYYDSLRYDCAVCGLRFVESHCPAGHEPRSCAACKWELMENVVGCPKCGETNTALTQSQKLQKLMAKVANDRDSFGSTSSDAEISHKSFFYGESEGEIDSDPDFAMDGVTESEAELTSNSVDDSETESPTTNTAIDVLMEPGIDTANLQSASATEASTESANAVTHAAPNPTTITALADFGPEPTSALANEFFPTVSANAVTHAAPNSTTTTAFTDFGPEPTSALASEFFSSPTTTTTTAKPAHAPTSHTPQTATAAAAALYDTKEEVWRCGTCSWEIEADATHTLGLCRNGHSIRLAFLEGYVPAYDDSSEAGEISGEGEEWDSDDLLEGDDGGVVEPDEGTRVFVRAG